MEEQKEMISPEQHERNQEEANWGACFESALKSGYTKEQAENCDDAELKCKDCPWGKK